MKTLRLGAGDVRVARAMFSMMAATFAEPGGELSDEYVADLLSRPGFWAIVALDGDEVVGCVTAHALPMTREQASELFIYDIAVRPDRQRRGVGRSLVGHLRRAAAAEEIGAVFVAADREDDHAIDFYRALGGEESPVAFFTLERED
jgi:aminoglycoside 3-N-acetyltransferase I